jgi:hypothetical protein
MNNNLILLPYLLISNKKFKLFNFDNYYWKLFCILDFNDNYLNIESKIFDKEYKIFYNLKKIINILHLDIKNSKIKQIIATNRRISYIPEYLNILINLEYLNLNYNKLIFIPNNLISLKYLNISSNYLSFISKKINNLINLKYLDVSSNKITLICKQLDNLKNLTHFNICRNKLKIIPKQLGKLINLKIFYISYILYQKIFVII